VCKRDGVSGELTCAQVVLVKFHFGVRLLWWPHGRSEAVLINALSSLIQACQPATPTIRREDILPEKDRRIASDFALQPTLLCTPTSILHTHTRAQSLDNTHFERPRAACHTVSVDITAVGGITVADGVAITTTSTVAGAGGTHDTAGVTAVVVDSFQGWQWAVLWGTFIALPRRCLLRTCAALHCTALHWLLPLCHHLLPLCFCQCASLPPPAASLLLPLCLSATTCCLSATASQCASRFIRQFSQQPTHCHCVLPVLRPVQPTARQLLRRHMDQRPTLSDQCTSHHRRRWLSSSHNPLRTLPRQGRASCAWDRTTVLGLTRESSCRLTSKK
jgi:hypothetical protein